MRQPVQQPWHSFVKPSSSGSANNLPLLLLLSHSATHRCHGQQRTPKPGTLPLQQPWQPSTEPTQHGHQCIGSTASVHTAHLQQLLLPAMQRLAPLHCCHKCADDAVHCSGGLVVGAVPSRRELQIDGLRQLPLGSVTPYGMNPGVIAS